MDQPHVVDGSIIRPYPYHLYPIESCNMISLNILEVIFLRSHWIIVFWLETMIKYQISHLVLHSCSLPFPKRLLSYLCVMKPWKIKFYQFMERDITRLILQQFYLLGCNINSEVFIRISERNRIHYPGIVTVIVDFCPLFWVYWIKKILYKTKKQWKEYKRVIDWKLSTTVSL